MNDNETPTGARRLVVRGFAYVRVGFWILKELNPWRRSYGRRK